MAITMPKQKMPAIPSADAFISGAPDATGQVRGVVKGNKRQISLTISPELLDKVDQLASETGQSRAAVINLAIYRLTQAGV
ncbi:ribbon-helix-helix domain-containing protein [Chitinimonas sp. BJB300]|uniref:ribbon-helix-helix domain-containing protein n=1 Tax=Chitinimonas sp. BJB300 TaxID=1559339 RepID=UPI000C0D0A09|nr:ribbon-helix-helix domain-containing protein [Chitinimonas sp. BJB300]PHV11926.1 CopG family transcriptional regulator [Chitinimonas sp. BJB300]TSJ84480.1 CopG family transcriptional regulator [Chitinimonas sp. BJB300]